MKTNVSSIEIGAAKFKATCLALIDEIHDRKRNSVVITKRGKPVAKLVPIDDSGSFIGCMKGLVTIHGDLTEPLNVEWEALKR